METIITIEYKNGESYEIRDVENHKISNDCFMVDLLKATIDYKTKEYRKGLMIFPLVNIQSIDIEKITKGE